jgi:hypothetical protein
MAKMLHSRGSVMVRNLQGLRIIPGNFIIEPALKPFVDATRVRRTEGEDAFNTIINMVEKKVNSGHG